MARSAVTAFSGPVILINRLPPADIRVWVEPTEVAVKPGDEVSFTVHVERRHGFGQRVPVDVRTLSHGTRVLNVGLNGVLPWGAASGS